MRILILSLILSLYITSARILAPTDYPDLVSNLPNYTSGALPNTYAGFAPLDDQNTSALFYWFFPVNGQYSNDVPTLIWLEGGPGASSIGTVFVENGPFRFRQNSDGGFSMYTIDQPGKLQSWTAFYNVLYIDSPLGAGYSYTADGNYSTNEDEIGNNVWTAIQYFMNVHPETQDAKWYYTGLSYGGRFVPAATYWTLQNNELVKSGKLQGKVIDLQGMMVGSGFVIGVGQRLTTTDAVQAANMLTPTQYSQVKTIAAECQQLSGMGSNYTAQAVSRCNDLLGYYSSISGFGPMVLFEDNDEVGKFGIGIQQYFNDPTVITAMHADGSKKQGTKFDSTSGAAAKALEGDILGNSLNYINFLLTQIPCLFFNGNLDGQDGSFSTNLWFKLLAQPYPNILNASRSVWYIDGFSAGMYSHYENMTFVIIDATGHFIPHFNLNATVKMLEIFTNGNSHWDRYAGFTPTPTPQIMKQYSNNCNGNGTSTDIGTCVCNEGYGLGDCSVKAVSIQAQIPYPISLNQRGYAFLAVPLNGNDMIAEFQNESGVAGIYYTPFAPGPVADDEEAEASLFPAEGAPVNRSLYLNSYGKSVGYLTIQNSKWFDQVNFQVVLTPVSQSRVTAEAIPGRVFMFGFSAVLYTLAVLLIIITIGIIKAFRDKKDKAKRVRDDGMKNEATQALIE